MPKTVEFNDLTTDERVLANEIFDRILVDVRDWVLRLDVPQEGYHHYRDFDIDFPAHGIKSVGWLASQVVQENTTDLKDDGFVIETMFRYNSKVCVWVYPVKDSADELLDALKVDDTKVDFDELMALPTLEDDDEQARQAFIRDGKIVENFLDEFVEQVSGPWFFDASDLEEMTAPEVVGDIENAIEYRCKGGWDNTDYNVDGNKIYVFRK